MYNRPRILVIEDEPEILKLLNNHLLKKFDVLAAMDGKTGLRLIREELPDLVLLDIILPKMDGFEILVHKKEDPLIAGIPLVILSNLDSDEDLAKGKRLGALDFLVKPNTGSNELIEIIDKYLEVAVV